MRDTLFFAAEEYAGNSHVTFLDREATIRISRRGRLSR